MSLADKLKELEGSSPGLPCGIFRIKSSMPKEDYEALEAVLSVRYKSGGVSNRKIQQLLVSEGYDVAYSSITLHRRKECRCFMGKNGLFRNSLDDKEQK